MGLLQKASLVITPNAVKAGKLYSVIPNNGTGDLDVVRETSATRVNSAGLIETVGNNIARLDYTNGSCPSILVEPQRTNLVNYSEQFDNDYWTKGGVTIESNSILSPDGNLTADKVTVGVSGNRAIEKSISLLNGSFSIFAKKGSSDIVRLVTLGSFANVSFNLTNGTYIINSGTGFTASINPIGNDGWYMCAINNIANIAQLRIYPGVDNSYLYIWGAQLEAGANATSYIPTVASTVTRNADVISKSGISNLIGQTEGTIYFDGIVNNIQNAFSNILNTDKNLSLSTISLGKIKSDNKFLFTQLLGNNSSGSAIKLTSTNAFANGIRTKIAIRYKSGSFAMYINGNLESTSSSSFTNIGTKSELFLNDSVTFFHYQESVSFNSVVLFTSGLTNTELAQLTTL